MQSDTKQEAAARASESCDNVVKSSPVEGPQPPSASITREPGTTLRERRDHLQGSMNL